MERTVHAHPKPFVWTADPARILAAVKRGKQALESVRQMPKDKFFDNGHGCYQRLQD
jgi:hypothetical protein